MNRFAIFSSLAMAVRNASSFAFRSVAPPMASPLSRIDTRTTSGGRVGACATGALV